VNRSPLRRSAALAGFPGRKAGSRQFVEKAIPGFFNIGFFDSPFRKAWISNGFHFQWLAATENVGTSCTVQQAVEILRFSTARWSLSWGRFRKPPAPVQRTVGFGASP